MVSRDNYINRKETKHLNTILVLTLINIIKVNVFNGNRDSVMAVTNLFASVVDVRVIRVYDIKPAPGRNIGLRFDLLGCDKQCKY